MGPKRDYLFVSTVPPRDRGGARVDMIGRRFGRLFVRGFAFVRGPHRHWWCECDCGRVTHPASNKLLGGRTKSCGCQGLERRIEGVTKHGARSRKKGKWKNRAEYSSWAHMRRRCYCVTDKAYPDYGGRGIKVCDRWRIGENGKSGFACFLADVGPRPSPNHSLDRVNNDGNYEPSNVRWATSVQQGRNRRSNYYVDLNGSRVALAEACEKLGLKYGTIATRIKRGMHFSDAIATESRS